jgi:hypothetical protein
VASQGHHPLPVTFAGDPDGIQGTTPGVDNVVHGEGDGLAHPASSGVEELQEGAVSYRHWVVASNVLEEGLDLVYPECFGKSVGNTRRVNIGTGV